MRLIIAGTRRTGQSIALRIIEREVARLLADGQQVTEIISGGSGHVDSAGELYARSQGIPLKQFRANWSLHGSNSRIQKNVEMALYASGAPDGHLLLIWNGHHEDPSHLKTQALYRLLTITEIIINEHGEEIAGTPIGGWDQDDI